MQLGEPISQWTMYQALWKLKHPSIITLIGLAIYIVIALIFQTAGAVA